MHHPPFRNQAYFFPQKIRILMQISHFDDKHYPCVAHLVFKMCTRVHPAPNISRTRSEHNRNTPSADKPRKVPFNGNGAGGGCYQTQKGEFSGRVSGMLFVSETTFGRLPDKTALCWAGRRGKGMPWPLARAGSKSIPLTGSVAVHNKGTFPQRWLKRKSEPDTQGNNPTGGGVKSETTRAQGFNAFWLQVDGGCQRRGAVAAAGRVGSAGGGHSSAATLQLGAWSQPRHCRQQTTAAWGGQG